MHRATDIMINNCVTVITTYFIQQKSIFSNQVTSTAMSIIQHIVNNKNKSN